MSDVLVKPKIISAADPVAIWHDMKHLQGNKSTKHGKPEGWRVVGHDLIEGMQVAQSEEEFLVWATDRYPGINKTQTINTAWFTSRYDEIVDDIVQWPDLQSRPRFVRQWLYDCGDRRAHVPDWLYRDAPLLIELEDRKPALRHYDRVQKLSDWPDIPGITDQHLLLISQAVSHAMINKIRAVVEKARDPAIKAEIFHALLRRSANTPQGRKMNFGKVKAQGDGGVVPHYFLPHLPHSLVLPYLGKPDKIVRDWPILVQISNACGEARSKGACEGTLAEISRSIQNAAIQTERAKEPVTVKASAPIQAGLRLRYHGRDIWPLSDVESNPASSRAPTHSDIKAAIGIARYLTQILKAVDGYDASEMPLRLRRIALMLRTIEKPEAAARLLSSLAGAIEAAPNAEADEEISPQFLGSFTA